MGSSRLSTTAQPRVGFVQRMLPAVEGKVPLAAVVRWLIIALAVVWAVGPVLYLLANSVKPTIEYFNSPQILPSTVVWSHFQDLFASGNNTWRYLINSVVVTISTTACTVFFGSLAAYGLSRLRLGRSRLIAVVALVIIAVRFYPKITVVIPYFMLMRSLNLLDNVLAIIVAHVSITLPFAVLLMMTFYAEIPQEIEEAALIDGASLVQTYFRVIVPMTVTGMAAAALLTALVSWNEFLIASSVASNNAVTLPIDISTFISDKGTNWGSMSALAVLMTVPMLVLILFLQRFLVRGLTGGAVKG
ncbi:MAG: carbohydrate ABC transporter permease [Chloroflexi bacterium]|nr:carbohydrate ABC transporter permease [Chloroflexota bacterium]